MQINVSMFQCNALLCNNLEATLKLKTFSVGTTRLLDFKTSVLVRHGYLTLCNLEQFYERFITIEDV